MQCRIAILSLPALLLWAGTAAAAVPQTVSYQGLLRDAGGTIVPDGNYGLTFRIYSVAAGGSPLWTEAQTLPVQDGVFNALLGSVTALTLDFSTPYWLGVAVAADPELTPRVALAAAPYSLNADRLDGLSSGDFASSTHAHALDALSDVSVPAPVAGQVLTYNGAGWDAQTPVAGGDDWSNSGGDIYRYYGHVGIGIAPVGRTAVDENASAMNGRDAIFAKLQVHAQSSEEESAIYGRYYDGDDGNDGRAAVYGERDAEPFVSGLGYAAWETNSGVGGRNIWGDSYSFGVTGYTVFNNAYTGGVLGGSSDGSTWGALGYMDGTTLAWGLYTPANGYFGGRVGIGTGTPDRSLVVNNAAGSAVMGKVTYTGTQHYIGVEGHSVPAASYGIGGRFEGGYLGAQCVVNATGSGTCYGVYASASGGTGGGRYGVYGYASGPGSNFGIYGSAGGGSSNYAGWFVGDVQVSGTLSKSAGSFKIDHPLDPANKTLSHSFVESPDMMNVYNGIVVLGPNGSAWVEMPAWFEALNRDFRYQLTAIGGPGPNLHVAAKMTGNRFRIAGGQANLEVSWQVTGIRQDAYANAHRIPVEEMKMDQESGRYLHPELFGRPEAEAIGFRSPPVEK